MNSIVDVNSYSVLTANITNGKETVQDHILLAQCSALNLVLGNLLLQGLHVLVLEHEVTPEFAVHLRLRAERRSFCAAQ